MLVRVVRDVMVKLTPEIADVAIIDDEKDDFGLNILRKYTTMFGWTERDPQREEWPLGFGGVWWGLVGLGMHNFFLLCASPVIRGSRLRPYRQLFYYDLRRYCSLIALYLVTETAQRSW
jgi:hypothetical protein